MDHEEQLTKICAPAFNRIEAAQNSQHEQLDEMLDLLRGSNGTPGVIERIRLAEDRQVRQAETLTGHHEVLFGVGREKPGLVDDVRDQQRRHERTAKLAWTAIAGAVVQALVWIRGLFPGG